MTPDAVDGSAFAPAKINLFLHVGPLDAGGMHPLCSLMVFADVGDRISAAPADAFSLSIDGPFGDGLDGEADNLVTRAARALLSGVGRPNEALALVLTKALPLAAGLGGGSSDAGATLRLLRKRLTLDIDDAGLEAIAGSLGADGAACLFGHPVIGEGRGERLSPAPGLPLLHAVLVNPGAPSPTGAVYRAYDEQVRGATPDRPIMPKTFADIGETVAFLADCRNDLEAPAIGLSPVIGEALAMLASQPESLLTRMSGSGATCFVLCATRREARTLADRVAAGRADWWVRACRLGGPWSDGAAR
jgi:4-diphosphocytidyl-2-C-methyl-D-erythritol kinase